MCYFFSSRNRISFRSSWPCPTCRLFLPHVWKLHGFPRSIITYRDPTFVSAFSRACMARLKIHHNMTTSPELYAVWWGSQKVSTLLVRRHYTFKPTHQSLTHLTNSFQDFDKKRVVQWLERLLQYDFTVKYIEGVTNVVADALS